MPRSARWWLWLLCGIGIAAVALRLASLSQAFTWGDRARWADRPIREVVIWWMGAWLVYAVALRLGSALPPRVPSLIALLLVAAGARAAFFGTKPIQEDDAYRYSWDGQQALEGVDPYRWSPQEVLDEPRGKDAGLDRLKDVLARDVTGRETFGKINNKPVPTVYPPLNFPMFALAQRLAPWRLDGLRAIFLVLELATCALLWFALRTAGANPMWTAVYAWCPLTIKEMANSPHHDALVVCMLALFLLFAVTESPRLAAAALALATAAKIYPVALLPVLLVWAWRRDRRAAIAAGAVFAVALLACYAPFLHATTFRGAGVFASEWSSNSGLFTIFRKAGTRLFGDTPIASPLGAGQAPRGEFYARMLSAALICGGVGMAALTPRFPRPAIAPVGRPWDLPFRCYVALCFGFALAPAQHPWYFAGILPFVALFPYRSWVLLTATLALYYMRFYFQYHLLGKEAQDDAFEFVRVIEYAPFYALLAWEAYRGWVLSKEVAPATRMA